MPTPSSLSTEAARIALLGLRARFSSPSEALARVYRIGVASPLIPEDALLAQLAAAPKPILLSAELSDGVLRITWQSFTDGPHLFDFHVQCLEDARTRGGYMGFLRSFYGGTPHTLQVLCAGGGESLIVSLETVEQWSADYSGFGWIADGIDNPHAAENPIYVRARSVGAVGVVEFRAALNAPTDMAEQNVRLEMHVELDLTPPRAEESREAVEKRCLEAVSDIRIVMTIANSELRAAIQTYLDQMKRFFEPQVPPELERLLRDWHSRWGGSAA